MYQTTTQTQPRPQAARPFMLAGRQVARELLDAVEAAKRNGRRVTLVILTQHGDDTDVPPGVCANCLGAGNIGIDVFMAGPFQSVPTGKTDENGGVALRLAGHNGSWWQVARQFAPCPMCGSEVIQL